MLSAQLSALAIVPVLARRHGIDWCLDKRKTLAIQRQATAVEAFHSGSALGTRPAAAAQRYRLALPRLQITNCSVSAILDAAASSTVPPPGAHLISAGMRGGAVEAVFTRAAGQALSSPFPPVNGGASLVQAELSVTAFFIQLTWRPVHSVQTPVK